MGIMVYSLLWVVQMYIINRRDLRFGNVTSGAVASHR